NVSRSGCSAASLRSLSNRSSSISISSSSSKLSAISCRTRSSNGVPLFECSLAIRSPPETGRFRSNRYDNAEQLAKYGEPSNRPNARETGGQIRSQRPSRLAIRQSPLCCRRLRENEHVAPDFHACRADRGAEDQGPHYLR